MRVFWYLKITDVDYAHHAQKKKKSPPFSGLEFFIIFILVHVFIILHYNC